MSAVVGMKSMMHMRRRRATALVTTKAAAQRGVHAKSSTSKTTSEKNNFVHEFRNARSAGVHIALQHNMLEASLVTTLSPRDVSSLMHALVKVSASSRVPAFVSELENHLTEVSMQMNAREVATCLNSAWKLGAGNADDNAGDNVMRALQRRGEEVSADMNGIDVTICLTVVTKLKHMMNVEFARALQIRGATIAASMNARDVALALGALGKLNGHVEKEFVRALQRRGLSVSASMNAIDISNSLGIVAKLGKDADGRFARALQKRGIAVVDDMNARDVSSSLFALAKMADISGAFPVGGNAFTRALQRRGIDLAADMNARDVASSLRAILSLSSAEDIFTPTEGASEHTFMLALMEQGAMIASYMDGQDIAISLDAVSRRSMPSSSSPSSSSSSSTSSMTFQTAHSKIVRSLQVRGAAVVGSMKPIAVMLSLAAILRLENRDDVNMDFAHKVFEHALDATGLMNASEVVFCLDALSDERGLRARLGGNDASDDTYDLPSCDALVCALQQRAALMLATEMKPHHIAFCLNALSKLNPSQVDADLLSALQARGQEIASMMDARAVPLCLNALSKFESEDVIDADFVGALQSHGVRVAADMDEQAVANSLNAISREDGLLGDPNSDFISALQMRGVSVCARMTTQGIANCLYALQWIAADAVCTDFMRALQQRGTELSTYMNGQDVENSLFAAVKWDGKDHEFIAALQRRGVDAVTATMDAKSIAKSLYALTSLESHLVNADFVRALHERGNDVLDDFDDQSISLCFVAFERANEKPLDIASDFRATLENRTAKS